MKLKIGDIVTCIDSSNCPGLTQWKNYMVTYIQRFSSFGTMVTVLDDIGHHGTYYPRRFRLNNEYFCINIGMK